MVNIISVVLNLGLYIYIDYISLNSIIDNLASHHRTYVVLKQTFTNFADEFDL